ncbi:MAG: beta-lactamase family protein [Sphingomonadales bacterium]|jgi:CubicO group peptidase (beta-lactamase class C family)|nr:beta-lactamase family protein [Sphingomonadales bacterium]MBK9002756.1 beta-lactamase family protein [Sphingomonadales bacterium]MBK9267979.1 beta-lactamase family protein [Sphingomonadales bacterium]MBP6435344.1 beta-lactamase family protein [Sphingorhabdus sp.]
MSVSGQADGKFAGVKSVMEASLANGADLGASFCATKDGETVIDIWGGHTGPDKARSWERDTIVNVYSTTKTMTALTALLLADRGVFDLHDKVAKFWPEFAAEGKADVTIAQLLSHSSGLSGWKERLQREDLYDWSKCTDLLARQAPFWAPGTAPGYHALTQGYLVGEVIRRATGKTVGSVFKQEIADPLGADFHIGLPASEDARVAELVPPPVAVDAQASSELQRNMATNPGIDVGETAKREWRGAEIPAAGGTGNARSVAEIHAILANGGVAKGKRFLSEAGCRRALECQVEGTDLVLGIPVRFGMGFGLPGGMVPLPNPNSCYWGGYGGSIALIDMDAQTTFSYVMNRMEGTTTGDARGFALIMTVWQALAA